MESDHHARGYEPRPCPALTAMGCDRCASTRGAVVAKRTSGDVRGLASGISRLPAMDAVTEHHRPVWCHREDTILCHQASRTCVPSLERWRAYIDRRSGGSRTHRSFAPNERTEAGLVRSVVASPEALREPSGIRGGIRTRVSGLRNQKTNHCSTRT